jgi:4-amino-4-deoxy-L-arabinose transferase-like glycosyltransferase
LPESPFNTRTYFWVFTLLAALGLFAPIRSGDLAGYDDARYAIVAKDVLETGNWLDIRTNGAPAPEHPPLLPWLEAGLFSMFGLSDPLAKLPSALCGFGTILLVYWLARRLIGDPFSALLAMFVMATSVYFVKYAARAMTDVPFTFFTLCAICAWLLSEDDPRWYLAAGLFTAMAQMTRAMMGLALPLIFLIDWIVNRRSLSGRYIFGGLTLAFLPPVAWYAHWIHQYGFWFFGAHATFLRVEVYGSLSPPWRRFTGAFEYLWMICKSYWPWLPFMITGLVVVMRKRERRLWLLIPWIAVVFVLCAITRSRVLRYMLPAYPAFAVLSAIGLMRLIHKEYVTNALRIVTPVLGIGVLLIAIFPPVNWHAAEIRPIALAATAATTSNERVAFYDKGDPRYDETNQMLWYGGRYLAILLDREMLLDALRQPAARVFVMDQDAYRTYIDARVPHQVIGQSGHLICFRLCRGDAKTCPNPDS